MTTKAYKAGYRDGETVCVDQDPADFVSESDSWESWVFEGASGGDVAAWILPDRFLPLDQWGEYFYFDEIIETNPVLRAAWESACEEAERGWADAIRSHNISRRNALRLADAKGYRICVFGLPGGSVHVARLAEPGEADRVSREIFHPGPLGPYESQILTISEAADCRWQDGDLIYGDLVNYAIGEGGRLL